MKNLLLLLSAATLFASSAGAASVVIGQPPGPQSNCFPFGCAYNAEYQQVYTRSQFTSLGVISITQISFYNTQTNNGTTALTAGTFTISLSTTSADVNTLSTNFASNIGSDNRVVFAGSIAQPWAFGNTLTIPLTSPFTYDPTKGNLLLDVVGSGTSDATGGRLFLDTQGNILSGGSAVFSRDFCFNGIACNPGVNTIGYGLVTGFTYHPGAVAVSAASTVSLAILAIALCVAAAFQRRIQFGC